MIRSDTGRAADKRHVGPVEGVEVLVVEARALAQVAVVGLELLGDLGIGDQFIDSAPMLLHDVEIESFRVEQELGDARARDPRRILHRGIVFRPSIVGQIGIHRPAQHDRLKIVHPPLLPTGRQTVPKIGFGRPVVPRSDRRRGALEHEYLPRGLGQRRENLQSAGAGADQRDSLVGESGEGGAGGAAGVSVIPACRVEGLSGEVVHPRNHRQLQQVQYAGGHHVVAGGKQVAPVGVYHPSAGVLMPHRTLDPGVEERIAHQVEPVGDGLQVQPDLFAVGVALGRDVIEFLEQGQVLIGLHVTHHARVAVPVPGAADSAGPVDDPDALHAGLA